MDKNSTFPLPIAGYSVEGLVPEDAPRLQPLYEACADYVILEQGEPPAPNAAELEFAALPSQRTVADKFVFGLVHATGEIVGVLECNRGYPQEGYWWVGLLMVAPSVRGTGVATRFFQAFVAWVTGQGAERIALAVITTNSRAYRFWQSQGFTIHRTTEPIAFGKNYHTLHLMERPLDIERG